MTTNASTHGDSFVFPSSDGVRGRARVLPLEGGRNFRDLGGYRAIDGRSVRWGRLLRSGSLGRLTPGACAYLERLGIGAIYDFRSNLERAAEPTIWVGRRSPRFHSRDYELQFAQLVETLNRSPSPAELRATMLASYGRTAYTQADIYRRLFHDLLEIDEPVIFHCAAGKDRTGIAAALILAALGVSHAQIFEDYSLSDKLVDLEKEAATNQNAAGYGALSQLSPEMRAPLFASDPEYIQAAFMNIEREEGSIGNFLEVRLGVTPAHAERLRDRLLEVV